MHYQSGKYTNQAGKCLSALLVQLRQLHPLLDTVRRPIGFRPPLDQFPFAARSDSVRRPIRFRPLSDDLV